jgi:choline dehydrogenase-like flavoprotein
MTQKVAEFVAEKDIGRIRIKPWVLGEEPLPVEKEPAGHHHMGGTRMAADATQGIVDADCRVFGQPNLFVAGSSVFPSSGYANPTFTIVQLALRLSEKLATEV